MELNFSFAGLVCCHRGKTILHGVTGTFTAGRLTCLLGPSGAGKTTLIDSLTGHREDSLEGTVRVNGVPVPAWERRRFVSYSPQEVHLFEQLTVEETLRYAARFTLNGSDVSRRQVVDETIELLALEKIRGSRVCKLSGGERKRVSIGLELVVNPRIMFFDEPTTGLDSVTAMQILTHLKQLALGGRIVVCVVHQPNSALFRLFDDLFVLSGGRCMYSGPVCELDRTLRQAGLQCPRSHNPADHVLELACTEDDARLEYLFKHFSQPKCNFVDFAVDISHLYRREADVGEWTKFKVLFERSVVRSLRTPALFIGRVLFQILGAILFGLLVYDVGGNAEKVMQSISSIFVTIMMVWITNSTTTVLLYGTELPVIAKEYANGWYSVSAYYFSRMLIELPVTVLGSVPASIIVYLLTSHPMELYRMAMVALVTVLCGWIGQCMGMLLGSIFRIETAVVMVPYTNIAFFFINSYFVRLRDVLPVVRVLAYLSYFQYTFEGAIQATYGYDREDLPCDEVFCYFQKPRKILRVLDLEEDRYALDVLMLLLWVLALKVALFANIRRRLRRSFR